MLPVSPEKVDYIISVAREFREGSMAMVSEQLSETHQADTYTEHSLATIIEEFISGEHEQDSSYLELKAAIENLNEEELFGLVALMWIGRGTYGPDELDMALEDAKSSSNDHTAEYLIETPLLPDYLEEGRVLLSDD